jgi:hypothetical protein
MPRTRPPHKRILKRILQRPMHPLTDILNTGSVPHNQRLAKIRIHALALGIYPDQVQHLPAAVDNVGDAEVQLAGHDSGVRFVGQAVEVLERDGVEFILYIEAFYVLAVIFHYDVYEVVYGRCDSLSLLVVRIIN